MPSQAAGSPRGAAGGPLGSPGYALSRRYLRSGFAGATRGPPPFSFTTFHLLGIRRCLCSGPGFCLLARCVAWVRASGPSPGDLGTLWGQSPRPGQPKWQGGKVQGVPFRVGQRDRALIRGRRGGACVGTGQAGKVTGN